MSEYKRALSSIQLALAYIPDFDTAPFLNILSKREQLGGLDDEELRAFLIVRLHGIDRRSVIDLIAQYRSRLDSLLSPGRVYLIEIQVLAMLGEPASARLLMEKTAALLPHDARVLLEAEIATAEGSDPLQERTRAYLQSKNIDALRMLIGELIRRSDHLAVGSYAEELYSKTRDSRDLEVAAQAYADAGSDDDFLRLVTDSPSVEHQHPRLKIHHAWLLLRRGDPKGARALTDDLRNSGLRSNYNLEIAVSIESGDWDSIGAVLSAVLADRDNQTALALIQAAHLSQSIGQGPTRDLVHAAIAKGPSDPNVLLGAYMISVEQGSEERDASAAEWLSRALDLSGDDGPIKRFEIRELLSQQEAWNQSVRNITSAVTRGDLPLLLAAPGLRTTFVEAVLRNLVRNMTVQDARRKTALPLFSGVRLPRGLPNGGALCLDISSLLVLGWLGLLPTVLDVYATVHLSSSIFAELFEGRRQIKEFQRSRAVHARELTDLIARHRIHVERSVVHSDLASQIGPELAHLIVSANTHGGRVVRPSPIHSIKRHGENADVADHASILSGLRPVLDTLALQGAVDQTTEETARRYFDVRDQGWPEDGPLDLEKPLYVDSLAITYLQSVGLLGPLASTFRTVVIDGSVEDSALALLEREDHTAAVLEVIDLIRRTVRDAFAVGKVFLRPRRLSTGGDEGRNTSTVQLLNDLSQVGVLCVDDRAMNKELFAIDKQDVRVPLGTTLDIIQDLVERENISNAEWMAYRRKLRNGGATLLSITAQEIEVAVQRNRQVPSSEFRSLEASIDLARISAIPQFPREIPWFSSILSATVHAAQQVWNSKVDDSTGGKLADDVLLFQPDVVDWISCWPIVTPPEWVDAVRLAMLTALALPFQLTRPEAVSQYGSWLERRVLDPMRRNRPNQYLQLTNRIREFLLTESEGSRDD
jgi:hypothetical protein